MLHTFPTETCRDKNIQRSLVFLHGGETLVKLLVKLCKTHGKTHISRGETLVKLGETW
jgi:hypothetical protein